MEPHHHWHEVGLHHEGVHWRVSAVGMVGWVRELVGWELVSWELVVMRGVGVGMRGGSVGIRGVGRGCCSIGCCLHAYTV